MKPTEVISTIDKGDYELRKEIVYYGGNGSPTEWTMAYSKDGGFHR